MAYTTEEKKFGFTGKGEENKGKTYPARQVVDASWKHENEAELVTDLLSICEGSFAKVQAITLNAVNQYLRFKDQPGADPMTKLLAFAKKAGISAEDLLSQLSK